MNRRARVRIRTVVVPLHSVPCLYLLYSGLAWLAQVMCLLPVFVLVPCLYYCTVRTGNVCFTRFVLVPCCGCTLAQCVPCLYLLPVFVLVPCVYYCTVGPGNVRFTRFVLVPCCGCTIAPRFVLAPCCGCTIAPCVGNVPFTRFCTRAVRVLCTVLYSCRACTIAQSARINVRFTRCTRAVLWMYHCTAFCTRAVQQ